MIILNCYLSNSNSDVRATKCLTAETVDVYVNQLCAVCCELIVMQFPPRARLFVPTLAKITNSLIDSLQGVSGHTGHR
jgi:hypothetical protein